MAARRRVRVALLSNGDELRPGGGAAVRDSNRPMLRALLASRPDIVCTDLGPLPDDPPALRAALSRAAADHDLILSTGGVSGSDADHMFRAIVAAGGRVEVLKLALKPGKPLAHGRIGGAFCLCLPGNPVAALVTDADQRRAAGARPPAGCLQGGRRRDARARRRWCGELGGLMRASLFGWRRAARTEMGFAIRIVRLLRKPRGAPTNGGFCENLRNRLGTGPPRT